MSDDTQKDETPEVEEKSAAAADDAVAGETEAGKKAEAAAPAEEKAEKTEDTEKPEVKAEESADSKASETDGEAAAEAASDSDVKPVEGSSSEGTAPPVEEKTDALKKAEAILRTSAPAFARRESDDNVFEKVVHINRCAKVVKGGRRFSFSALVVTGDKEGKVGFGFGKAQEVAECIKKASESSKRAMVSVKITENTIPHPVIGEHGGGRVLLRPASPGTGLIAGGGVRAVVEAAGIKDVLAKSMGSNNPANVIKATLDALDKLRTKKEIYTLRGKKLEEDKAI